MKVLGNPWFATVVTLLPGLALAFGGYANIWPLFGASNQLLGGMTMITLAVFCKCTGRKGWMLYVRRLPALLHLHFAGPERHGLHDRRPGLRFLRHHPGYRHHGCRFRRRYQGPAARLRRPADGPGPHRCRQLPQGVLRQAGRSMPDEEPEWSEMGKVEYGRAAAAEAPADAEAAKRNRPDELNVTSIQLDKTGSAIARARSFLCKSGRRPSVLADVLRG